MTPIWVACTCATRLLLLVGVPTFGLTPEDVLLIMREERRDRMWSLGLPDEGSIFFLGMSEWWREEKRRAYSTCMYAYHSDDIAFVSLWCLYCNYLLMRLVFPPHTSTYIDMFTGDQITKSTRCNIEMLCHNPSHGGSYMAEGAFHIRIGLPPRVVSGDCLASSRLWTDCLHCYRAHPMSREWGCISMSFPYLSMQP